MKGFLLKIIKSLITAWGIAQHLKIIHKLININNLNIIDILWEYAPNYQQKLLTAILMYLLLTTVRNVTLDESLATSWVVCKLI